MIDVAHVLILDMDADEIILWVLYPGCIVVIRDRRDLRPVN
jgi:hypothetical protein